MKQILKIMSCILLAGVLFSCDSTTGRIIDDYNRSKHPIARVSALPDAVTADNEANISVGGKDITAYRYRLNNSAWSTEYQVDMVLELRDIDPGKQKLEVIGTINGRDWQAQNQATACSWEVVPDWNCLKSLTVNDKELTPAFDPYADSAEQEYSVTVPESLEFVILERTLFAPESDVAVYFRYWNQGNEDKEETDGDEIKEFVEMEQVRRFMMDEPRKKIVEIRVQSRTSNTFRLYRLIVNSDVRKWGEAEIISRDDTNNTMPGLVATGRGEIFLAWHEDIGSKSNICARQYNKRDGWMNRQVLHTFNKSNYNGLGEQPSISTDTFGNVMVVWKHHDGEADCIWSIKYLRDRGWGSSEKLAAYNTIGNERFMSPKCAFDHNGNALAVWCVQVGDKYTMMYCTYTINQGWSEAKVYNLPGIVSFGEPQIKFDGLGNAFVVWYSVAGSVTNSYCVLYNFSSGWGNVVNLANCKYTDYLVRFDVNYQGDAVFVWLQYNKEIVPAIYSRTYSVKTGWSNSQQIDTNKFRCSGPNVAMDPYGNAIATWQSDNYIKTRRYMPGKGWGEIESISQQFILKAQVSLYIPEIAFDHEGNALAIWCQLIGDKKYTYHANRYYKNYGWGVPEIIGDSDNPSYYFTNTASLLFDYDGEAFAVWSNSKKDWETSELYFNTFK